jgi:hypothetical protein
MNRLTITNETSVLSHIADCPCPTDVNQAAIADCPLRIAILIS